MKYTINDREVTQEEWATSLEDGVHRWYYNNGQLKCKTPYVNGQEHGIAEWYDKNGTLRHKTAYVHGKEMEDLIGNKLMLLILFGSTQ